MKRVLILMGLSLFSYSAAASEFGVSSARHTLDYEGTPVKTTGYTLAGAIDLNDNVSVSMAYESYRGSFNLYTLEPITAIPILYRANILKLGALYKLPISNKVTAHLGANHNITDVTVALGGSALDDSSTGTDLITRFTYQASPTVNLLAQLNMPTDTEVEKTFLFGAKYMYLPGSYLGLSRKTSGATTGTFVTMGVAF